MVKYKYDTDTMIAKIREQWTPNDFLEETERLMRIGGLYKDTENG